MKIALLGAPGTGKTELTLALKCRLQSAGNEVFDIPHTANISRLAPSHITLLCGLDLPDPQKLESDPHSARREREVIDQVIRQQLDEARIPYQVVYGLGPERLDNALFAIARQTPNWRMPSRPEVLNPWTGACERCADAQCEHRLFTDLLQQKSI
ncbi:hypothetical protein [Limnohabitans sp.]|uniref:hypothetical protein n=1 Tax=Limnohabitans sp. TaxID=1907725 RepID=UPI0038B9A862